MDLPVVAPVGSRYWFVGAEVRASHHHGPLARPVLNARARWACLLALLLPFLLASLLASLFASLGPLGRFAVLRRFGIPFAMGGTCRRLGSGVLLHGGLILRDLRLGLHRRGFLLSDRRLFWGRRRLLLNNRRRDFGRLDFGRLGFGRLDLERLDLGRLRVGRLRVGRFGLGRLDLRRLGFRDGRLLRRGGGLVLVLILVLRNCRLFLSGGRLLLDERRLLIRHGRLLLLRDCGFRFRSSRFLLDHRRLAVRRNGFVIRNGRSVLRNCRLVFDWRLLSRLLLVRLLLGRRRFFFQGDHGLVRYDGRLL